MIKIFLKRIRGTTLPEVMLVLSIASLLIVLGIKLYQSFQDTAQMQALIYNVDSLFEAASNYYHANCAAGSFSPTPPSFLSPYPVNSGTVTYPPAANAYYPISITTTLLQNGYLQNWSPANPAVDPSGGESGYIVQLNPIISTQPIPVNVCVVTNAGTPCLPITTGNSASPNAAYSSAPSSSIATSQALVVTWAIQVAVKIQPPSKIASTAAFIGADCLSDSSIVNTIDPCTVGNSSHNYAVWSRIPAASAKKRSVFSNSMQLLKQYNRLYTHDPNYELNAGYSSTSNPAQAPVYYLCGG